MAPGSPAPEGSIMKSRLGMLLLILAIGTEATGQQPPVRLRSFGVPPASRTTSQSRLSILAGQLSLQLQAARGELASLALNPVQRNALVQVADRASRAADEFHRLTLQTGDPNRLATAHLTVDRTLEQLAATANQVAPGNPTVAHAINRVRYADERVHTALHGDQPGGDAQRDIVVRSVHRLAEQANDLQAAVERIAGVSLQRSLRSFSNQSSRLARRVEGPAGVEVARQEYAGLASLWTAIARDLTPLSATNPTIRLRATRVNNLMSDLARVLRPESDWLPPPPDFGIIPPKNVVLVVGAGARGGPHVRVFHDPRGGASSDFFAYAPTYKGGVRVAVADLDGDGFPDIITAPGRDHVPLIRVFSGRDLGLLAEFIAYDPPFTLGVNVAAADLTRDGRALVAVAPGQGGPAHIKVFDLAAGRLIDDFYAHPKELNCGARLALADVTGDGQPDLITAPAGGAGPLIQVWNGRNRERIAQFNAFDEKWTNGVYVTVGSRLGGRRAEIIAGSGEGTPSLVRVFDPRTGRQLREYTPFDPAFRSGVRVAGVDASGDGVDDLVCAPGPGPQTAIRIIDGRSRRLFAEFVPFIDFAGGSYVAGR
jgi:hypothetical protein